MSLSVLDTIERFLKARSRTLHPSTVAGQRLSLMRLGAWLTARGVTDPRCLVPADLAAFAAMLLAYRYRRGKKKDGFTHALAPATVYTRLGHVRHFLSWLAAERLVLADLSSSIHRKWKGHRLPKTPLSEAEAVKLMRSTDPSTALGIRDRAMLELLYSSGLRISELRNLDVADLDLTGGTVLVRRGKGGKDRLVPIGKSAIRALEEYLQDARPLLTKLPGAQALFLSCSRGGNLGKRTTTEQLSARLRKAVAVSGLTRPVSPHTLRHTMATHLLRAGADVRRVQEILGHASVETTEIYTHVAVRDLAEVHARSHPRGGKPRERKRS